MSKKLERQRRALARFQILGLAEWSRTTEALKDPVDGTVKVEHYRAYVLRKQAERKALERAVHHG